MRGFQCSFYGAPGTGKTTFVRALAYSSGLDYALTSGSEFAKITDLNLVSNELRKLLNWAKRSKMGLLFLLMKPNLCLPIESYKLHPRQHKI